MARKDDFYFIFVCWLHEEFNWRAGTLRATKVNVPRGTLYLSADDEG